MDTLQKLLVVMDPGVTEEEDRLQVALIRAMDFADRTGAQIELFSNCADDSIVPSMWQGSEATRNERKRLLDERYDWLEIIATRLRIKGYATAAEAVWSHPRADAISRKAMLDGCDLVLKQPDDHRYVTGILTNTDWELIRTCPIPCLFTKAEAPHGSGHSVLSCIDPTQDADDELKAASLDYSIFEAARIMATALNVPIDVVNAFQIPQSISHQLISYAPAIPSLGGKTMPAGDPAYTPTPAERHGSALKAFADYFDYPVEKIIVEEGRPADVICRAAGIQRATMIVMGALERGRLERAFMSVNAEPVLDKAPCDVLFIKPAEHSIELSDLEEPLLRRTSSSSAAGSLPAIDIEQAMVDPAAVFTEPMCVNRRPDLSTHEKRKILRSWELDQVRLQESAYEGELVDDESYSLAAVKTAERLLRELPATGARPIGHQTQHASH